jgi:hypothetical protein
MGAKNILLSVTAVGFFGLLGIISYPGASTNTSQAPGEQKLGYVAPSRSLITRKANSFIAPPEYIYGCRIAWAQQQGAKWVVVVDGKAGPAFDTVDDLIFSPYGDSFAYVAKDAGRQFVVFNNQPDSQYNGIVADSMAFSIDGRHLAYKVLDGYRWFIIADGRPGPELDGTLLGNPLFSLDGRRLGYMVQSGGTGFVVVDNQPGPDYQAVGGLVFSPDSRHFAYSAVINGRWFVVIGNKLSPGPGYDQITCGPVFLEDGSVEYMAIRAGQLYRVRTGL